VFSNLNTVFTNGIRVNIESLENLKLDLYLTTRKLDPLVRRLWLEVITQERLL